MIALILFFLYSCLALPLPGRTFKSSGLHSSETPQYSNRNAISHIDFNGGTSSLLNLNPPAITHSKNIQKSFRSPHKIKNQKIIDKHVKELNSKGDLELASKIDNNFLKMKKLQTEIQEKERAIRNSNMPDLDKINSLQKLKDQSAAIQSEFVNQPAAIQLNVFRKLFS